MRVRMSLREFRQWLFTIEYEQEMQEGGGGGGR